MLYEALHEHDNLCCMQPEILPVCNIYDTESIHSAKNEALHNGFSYFPLGLSEYTQHLFNKAHVTNGDSQPLTYPHQMDTQIFNVLKKNTNGLDSEEMSYLSQVISKTANDILSANQHKDSQIHLVTHVPDNTDDPFLLYYTQNLYWHIDKTLEEINKLPQSNIEELNYLAVFKGNTTFFYPTDDKLREAFLKVQDENEIYAYGHSEKQLDSKLFDQEKWIKPEYVTNTPFNYGSAHISGGLNGTVHCAPIPHERIVLLITPR